MTDAPATHADDDSAEELYEDAPCGQLSATMDGTIVKINTTLLRWIGRVRDEVVGQVRFTDLFTVGGRIFYETHLSPLLRMQGQVGGIALELRTGDGPTLPVLFSAVVKTGADGRPLVMRVTVFDARDRRTYERELLDARRRADTHRDRLREHNLGLQRSLLPPLLPTFPGVDLAAYYHMASDAQVGGDFYDVFPLPSGDGRWGFLLGDVCGKGIDAAALTATARNTLRAASAYTDDPADGLRLLNTIIYQDQRDSTVRFCTAVFGIGHRTDAGLALRLAAGGHPPPLLIRADGAVDFHRLPPGPIIGGLPRARYASGELSLNPGDTLLLYTDGITEARTDDADDRDGGRQLRQAVADHPGTATDVIDVLRGLLDQIGDGITDDVALLAMTATR